MDCLAPLKQTCQKHMAELECQLSRNRNTSNKFRGSISTRLKYFWLGHYTTAWSIKLKHAASCCMIETSMLPFYKNCNLFFYYYYYFSIPVNICRFPFLEMLKYKKIWISNHQNLAIQYWNIPTHPAWWYLGKIFHL